VLIRDETKWSLPREDPVRLESRAAGSDACETMRTRAEILTFGQLLKRKSEPLRDHRDRRASDLPIVGSELAARQTMSIENMCGRTFGNSSPIAAQSSSWRFDPFLSVPS
jgi:hypothetical protein